MAASGCEKTPSIRTGNAQADIFSCTTAMFDHTSCVASGPPFLVQTRKRQMEFRENYLGIPARIRYNNQTNAYICDIDTPEALRIVANSYEELQKLVQEAVEDFLSGNRGALDHNQTAFLRLERAAIVGES